MPKKHRKKLKHVDHAKKHIIKKQDVLARLDSWRKKIKFTPEVGLILVAVALLTGYFIGSHGYQIKSYVKAILGYGVVESIDLSSIERTYNELASKYDGNLDAEKLIDGANAGMVAAIGDAYTMYMSAEEASEYNDSLEGNIGGGIGALVGMKNGQVTIMSVLEDNPAIAAGLKGGDIVLAIDDESAAAMTVDVAVTKIRGKEGTTVKLLIGRNGEQMTFNITRAIINNPSVIDRIEDGVGIIEISRFDEETGRLARQAANDFVKQGVEKVVLDLRDNPGGYVDTAVEVAGLWIDNDVIVTERKDTEIVDTIKSGSDAILADMETVVLVNYSSASASEIVAGALQDYGIAKIVGNQTYGKGSVQQLVPLSYGSLLKVTIARWYTPNGTNITSSGITPDYSINITQSDVDNDVDPQLNKAFELLNL